MKVLWAKDFSKRVCEGYGFDRLRKEFVIYMIL